MKLKPKTYLIMISMLFSFAQAEAIPPCEKLYPKNFNSNDPFSEVRKYCSIVESLYPSVQAEINQTSRNQLADFQLVLIKRMGQMGRNQSVDFQTVLGEAAAFAFKGKNCSYLLLNDVPSLPKAPIRERHLWWSAAVGVCRGIEMNQPHFVEYPRREEKWGFNTVLQNFTALKRNDGFIPELESSILSLSLKEYPSQVEDLHDALEEFVKKTLSLPIEAPLQFEQSKSGGSGDLSYFVKNEVGQPIAFVKVYLTHTNFVEAMAAEKILDSLSLKKSAHAAILGYGQVRGPDGKFYPVHLETFLPGKTLLDWVRTYARGRAASDFEILQRAVVGLADGVSEVHTLPSDSQISRGRLHYYQDHLRGWTDNLEEQLEKSPNFNVPFKIAQIRSYNESLIAACEQTSWTKGSIIFGDSALSPNVIFNSDNNQLSFIDVMQINRSLNEHSQPQSHPTFELADIVENLIQLLLIFELSPEQIESLEKLFKDRYASVAGQDLFNDPCYQMRSWHWRVELLHRYLSYLEDKGTPEARVIVLNRLVNQFIAEIDSAVRAQRSQ